MTSEFFNKNLKMHVTDFFFNSVVEWSWKKSDYHFNDKIHGYEDEIGGKNIVKQIGDYGGNNDEEDLTIVQMNFLIYISTVPVDQKSEWHQEATLVNSYLEMLNRRDILIIISPLILSQLIKDIF